MNLTKIEEIIYDELKAGWLLVKGTEYGEGLKEKVGDTSMRLVPARTIEHFLELKLIKSIGYTGLAYKLNCKKNYK